MPSLQWARSFGCWNAKKYDKIIYCGQLLIIVKKCHIDNICVLHWSWSESEVVVIDVSSASVVGSVIKYIEYIFNMLIPTFFQISIFEIKIARLILPVDELSFGSAGIFVVIGLSTGSFVIPKFPKKGFL